MYFETKFWLCERELSGLNLELHVSYVKYALTVDNCKVEAPKVDSINSVEEVVSHQSFNQQPNDIIRDLNLINKSSELPTPLLLNEENLIH